MLKRIKYFQWLLWILMSGIMIFLYHNTIIENSRNQIIGSILIIVCMISIFYFRRLKMRLQIKNAGLKTFGKKNGFNSIMLVNIFLGVIWITLGILTNDTSDYIFRYTLGSCFIIAGLYNMTRYYLQITDIEIIKMDIDYIKIRNIKSISFSNDKIILKTKKRRINVFYAEMEKDEKQLIIEAFKAINMKNNLA